MALYNFNNKYRGLAVIIINKAFTAKGFPDRKGSDMDSYMMYWMFKDLGFEVRLYEDCKLKDFVDVLKKASEWEHHADSDCFVCVVSSHGAEKNIRKGAGPIPPGATVWKNSVSASDGGDVQVEDIVKQFNDENCAALKGKPKLFFIQACRIRHQPGESGYDFGMEVMSTTKGDNGDDGGEDEVDNTGDKTGELGNGDGDGNQSGDVSAEGDAVQDLAKRMEPLVLDAHLDVADSGGSPDSRNLPPVPYDVVPLECPKDCLVMFPVGTGKYALRNQKYGSYLLRYLDNNCHKSKLEDGTWTLLQYLTMVCHEMGEYEFNPVKPYHNNFTALTTEEKKNIIVQMDLKKTTGLTEEELLNLPCKMTAHVVHRLRGVVRFTPKN